MMSTQLSQIAKKAKLDRTVRFTSLAHLAAALQRRRLRISRIRLSDKTSRLHPRHVVSKRS
jgi:hypothetical protein